MPDEKMPLTEHLVELRKRIIVSVIAIGIGFGICFNYSEDIFRILILPMKSSLSFSLTYPFITLLIKQTSPATLIFTAPAEAFWMHMKISFIVGFVFALPVVFHQTWRFVSPGLVHKEKKYVIPFVLTTTTLFLAGAAFCYFLVLPFALKFLLEYKTANMKPFLSVGHYVDFCLKFILAFGVIFELPVVIVFLTRLGVVTPKFLAKNRKYAVLIAFIIAAILTPTPDAFNQTLMALPIILLYEIGIWVSRIFVRKPAEAERREDADSKG